MTLDKDLIDDVQNGQVDLDNIKAAELKELIALPETQEYTLKMVGERSVNLAVQLFLEKRDQYNLNTCYNRQLIEDNKNMVVVKDGEIRLSQLGLIKTMRGHLNYMIEIHDKDIEVHWHRIVLEALKVPRNLVFINLGLKIIETVNKMERKYFDDNTTALLPDKLSGAMQSIEQALKENDKSYKYISKCGIDDWIRDMLKFDIGKDLVEFENDLRKLQKLVNKRDELLRKRAGKGMI